MRKHKYTVQLDLSILLLYLLLIKVMSVSSDLLKNIHFIELILNAMIIVVGISMIFKLKYTKRELIFLIFMFGIYFTVSLMTSELILFISVFAMLLIKRFSLEEIIERSFKFKSIFLIIHIVFYIMVLMFSPNAIDITYSSSGVARYTFFMGHANNFSGILFWIICEYIYLHFSSFRLKNILCIIFISLVVYHFTVSRTFLISIVLLLLLMVSIKFRLFKSFIRFFSKYGFMILSIVSFIIITEQLSFINGYTDILNRIDLLFSRRLTLGILSYREFGLAFFPVQIDYSIKVLWEGVYQTNLVLDNFYFRCLVSYGVFFLLFLSMMLYSSANYFKKDIRVCLFIVLACIMAFSETYISNPIIAFPLYFVADRFIRKGHDDAL